jgi:hypothetical protein
VGSAACAWHFECRIRKAHGTEYAVFLAWWEARIASAPRNWWARFTAESLWARTLGHEGPLVYRPGAAPEPEGENHMLPPEENLRRLREIVWGLEGQMREGEGDGEALSLPGA